MRVFMLGWEFPPYISGGLGTACYGLTRALDRRGVGITFALPRATDGARAEHVELLSAETVGREASAPAGPDDPRSDDDEPFRLMKLLGVPSALLHPYQRSADEGPVGGDSPGVSRSRVGGPPGGPPETRAGDGAGGDYGSDLIEHVERYARFCLEASRRVEFDVVHAHDWMTYPAGLWIARASGKPLVAHVHSTEFDRSGVDVNQAIYDIERRGMHGALRVIAVSQLTRGTAIARYGVPPEQVDVVYNGVDLEPRHVGMTGIERRDKVVLYLGRITFQKGPEYFLRAARRVLEVMDNVKFVVAGSGDMARRMIEMAAEMGIGNRVLFTGFLRGNDISKVFSIADLYVMPSVSEPFGIAPLEAMSHDVPVLISKTSGVSEVLTHALKVDFWDIDDMADKIIAVLRHPPLSQTLREHGAFEVRRLTWDGAAQRCEQIYREAIHAMRHAPAESAR